MFVKESTKWNAELERLKVKFMLCGHLHKSFVLNKNDERSLLSHKYSVIVGSVCVKDELMGAAITLNKNKMTVCMTDESHSIIAMVKHCKNVVYMLVK